MTPAKPSLGLLRSLTDEHVLRALMDEPRLTRAEIATRTGISKPTASESVRRLAAAGLLRDTGERTTGRGRIGSYYALARDVGSALVVDIAPGGVVAETVDVHGTVTARARRPVPRPARPVEVAAAVRAAAAAVAPEPLHLAVVSAADPVDRRTGRLVHLPDAPHLLGELAPAEVLAPLVAGPVEVDNDVNWAARAERDADTGLHDFAYLHLGEGLGCAVVGDGEVRRGYTGLAGEIAHVVTAGPDGRAMPLIDVFAMLGLRRGGSTAIDGDRLLEVLHSADGPAGVLARAVAGVIAALVALADPAVVVLGGSWAQAVLDVTATEVARQPRPVPLRPAAVTAAPSLSGARRHAVLSLREAVVTARTGVTHTAGS